MGSAKGGQFAPKGIGTTVFGAGTLFGGGIASSMSGMTPAFHNVPNVHPENDEDGTPVPISNPTKPTDPKDWNDPEQTATWTPGSASPKELNGIPVSKWADAPKDIAGWAKIPGNPAIKESVMDSGFKQPASGAVIVEPDGRIWIAHPSNGYGGSKQVMPKGKQDIGLTLQQVAIKEAYEETGLKVRLVDHLMDGETATSKTRYYLAVREGGDPAHMGWESQAMSLVRSDQAKAMLGKVADQNAIDAAISHLHQLAKDAPEPAQTEVAPAKVSSVKPGTYEYHPDTGLPRPTFKIGSDTNPGWDLKVKALYRLAQNGDVAGLEAKTFGSNPYGKKATAYKEHLLEVMAGKGAVAVKPVAPKVEPVAAKPAVAEVAAVKPVAPKIDPASAGFAAAAAEAVAVKPAVHIAPAAVPAAVAVDPAVSPKAMPAPKTQAAFPGYEYHPTTGLPKPPPIGSASNPGWNGKVRSLHALAEAALMSGSTKALEAKTFGSNNYGKKATQYKEALLSSLKEQGFAPKKPSDPASAGIAAARAEAAAVAVAVKPAATPVAPKQIGAYDLVPKDADPLAVSVAGAMATYANNGDVSALSAKENWIALTSVHAYDAAIAHAQAVKDAGGAKTEGGLPFATPIPAPTPKTAISPNTPLTATDLGDGPKFMLNGMAGKANAGDTGFLMSHKADFESSTSKEAWRKAYDHAKAVSATGVGALSPSLGKPVSAKVSLSSPLSDMRLGKMVFAAKPASDPATVFPAVTNMAAKANAGDVKGLAAQKDTLTNATTPEAWQTAYEYAKAVNAAAAPKVDASKPSTHFQLSDMTPAGAKPGGSSQGGMYTDKDGAKWLVKSYPDSDQAKNEALASRLYNAAGAHAPEMQLVDLGGKYHGGTGIASRWLEGPTKPLSPSDPHAVKAAQKSFVMDAWLGNWDAVGAAHDNIVIDKNGKAIRVDPGGALLYRAMGSKKTDAEFGNTVPELHSLRDPTKNPQAASIYGSMTNEDIQHSARQLNVLDNSTIETLVNQWGPGTAADRAALTTKLILRKNDLLKQIPQLGKPTIPEVTANPVLANSAAKAPKSSFKPDLLSPPQDYHHWAGPGKGLSSSEAKNALTNEMANDVYALALTGNRTALKAYDPAGKSTSSQTTTQINIYKEKLLLEIDNQLHPTTAVGGKMTPLYAEVKSKGAGTNPGYAIAMDAQNYPPVAGANVGKISPNNKTGVGSYILLGKVNGKSVQDYWEQISPWKGTPHGGTSQSTPELDKIDFPTDIRKQHEVYAKSLKDLDNPGYNAIHAYTGSSFYKVNEQLRNGQGFTKLGKEIAVAMNSHVQDLPEGMAFRRGLDISGDALKALQSLKPGTVIQSPQFESMARPGHGFGGNVDLRIMAGQGAKGLYVNSISAHPGEGELLGAYGQRYAIHNVKINNAKTIVEMILLPHVDAVL
ncbi:ADP-ribosyltransferase [Candidatus Contendibacter odensensis]|uniref:Nudix hydrolase domain-containing protein n=1 Tax=Candidatus Contendobacter odensis Run_B_J11 TaxID=1400861 RepID=A0A7U7J5Y3_9GAMM|nr:ADP-ribosyltransferase [Candidatus Contendobacter odensis]CDH46952.1 hypothetical protein BN874_690002 [Candidatus Contendobacter odensis Run_B_J11]